MKIFAAVMAVFPHLVFAWTVEVRVDPMDDGETVEASHGLIQPLRAPRSPYSEIQSDLAFVCTGNREQVALRFTMPINAARQERLGGRSEVFGRVRWGGDEPNPFTGVVASGGSTIWFSSGMTYRFDRYDQVTFEVPWHGGISAIVRFDLEGAVDAVAEARKACNNGD